MPYFRVSVSRSLTPAKAAELSAGLGEALELLPGKTKDMIILDLDEGRKILVGGIMKDNFAFADIHYCGSYTYGIKRRFTEAVFAAFAKVLGTTREDASLSITEHTSWGSFGEFIDMMYADM